MPVKLGDIYQIGGTLRAYKWDVLFSQIPSDIQTLTGTGEGFNLRCVSTDVPKKTGETISVQLHGHEFPEPGIYKTSGTLVFTLVESVSPFTLALIRELQQLVWQDDTGQQADMQGDNSAAFEMIIRHLDNQDKPVWQYKLLRCYMEDHEIPTLDGTSSELVRPTITVRYTDFTSGPST